MVVELQQERRPPLHSDREGGAKVRVIHLPKQRRSLRTAPCLQRTQQTDRQRPCMYLSFNLSNCASRSAVCRHRALGRQITWPHSEQYAWIFSFPSGWRWITATTTSPCMCAHDDRLRRRKEAAVWIQLLSRIFFFPNKTSRRSHA